MKIDLEAEYNNRARVPDHPAIIAGWARDASAYRDQMFGELTRIDYGPTSRQRIDLFAPVGARADALPVLFIHGGYWQGLDPDHFSHMARGPNAHGIPVGVVGYDLCPAVTVREIIEQVEIAAMALHGRYGRPIVACGHSAGGQLTACLAAEDWRRMDPVLPDRLVAAGLAISGLFDLEPLLPTSINAKLGLDVEEARQCSPRLWPAPSGLAFDCWVGGAESGEYLRQSRTLAAIWAGAGVETSCVEVPGANHFTVVAGLADGDSAMTRRLAQMALP
jgi:arylformamidase